MSASPLFLLPPPPVRSVDSHRLLISSARRTETELARERWKQTHRDQPPSSSKLRLHPHSAPHPSQHRHPTGYRLSYRTQDTLQHKSKTRSFSAREAPSQFPHLEKEVTKSDLTERLPYFTPVHVKPRKPPDYPTQRNSYSYVFFLKADPKNPKRVTGPAKEVGRRFFIHPEWSSEKLGWVRFHHKTTPDMFRFSWM